VSSIFQELKRRNVFRVGIAYAVIAWLLAEVAEFSTGTFGAPDWVLKTFTVFLLLGFPLALFFAWAFELTPEGIKREHEVDREKSITARTGRKLDFLIIGVLAVMIVFLTYDKFVLDPARDAEMAKTAPQAAADEQAVAESGKSIAVLPFVNMSADADNEYFSDGISEEILNALARVKELKVAGRTSSFAFRDKDQDLRTIGEALNVAHILEGSVRKSGNKLRITAQLIKVDDGFHLWSDTYDRELTDVFAIQDEIATAILEQLKAQLLDGAQTELAVQRTDTEVYDLYLLARQRLYERKRLSIEAAAELLDKAIALDPGYAPAHAQRGIAFIFLADDAYGTLPIELAETQAKLHIDKALKLDPGLAEAHAALGLYHNERPGGGFFKAIPELQKALAINPNLIDASNWLHTAYANTGQSGKGLEILEDILERDPLYRPGIGNSILIYNRMGLQDRSWALLERAKPFMPNDSFIVRNEAITHFSLGQFAIGMPIVEAAIELQHASRYQRSALSVGLISTHQFERAVGEAVPTFKVLALWQLERKEEAALLAYDIALSDRDVAILFQFLNGEDRSEELISFLEERWASLDEFQVDFPPYSLVGYDEMSAVALAYARTGNQQKFIDALERVRLAHDRMKSQGADNYRFYLNEAVYYTLSGDAETALKHLASAIDMGFIGSSRLKAAWPALEPLEGDPRFEAIQSRMIEHLNRERKELGLEPVST
jgi:TolB-like protein/Tfp pilus assembly protein PilF